MAGVKSFTIEGREYEIPTVGSFDMDEAQIMWDYTGYALEDFGADENGVMTQERIDEVANMMKNPGFMRSLLHVAYRRGNRDATEKQIKAAVGKVSNVGALREWSAQFDMEEDDASPPDMTSELAPSSPSGSEENETSPSLSSGNGGSTLRSVLVEPAEILEPTGTTASDTSSQELDRTA